MFRKIFHRNINTRALPRIKLGNLIKYKLDSDPVNSYSITNVRNISASGISFFSKSELTKNKFLNIVINFPGLGPIEAKAQVARAIRTKNGDYEIGAHFISVDEAKKEELAERIEFILKKIAEHKSWWKRLFICGFIFILTTGCQLSTAYAEGFDLGICKLYPMIKTEERHEDNIFELSNDSESDLINTTTPGFILDFKTSGENIFKVEYDCDFIRYKKHNTGNRENSKLNTVFQLKGGEFFLKLNENYEQRTEVSTYSNIFNNYNFNDANMTLGADFNKLSFEAVYHNLIYDYSAIDSKDTHDENLYDLTGYYRFLPKTKALLEYAYGEIKYPNDYIRDGKYNEFLTGVKGDLTEKITGTVKLGYQWRDYKTSQDWKEAVTYTNVAYEISQKTLLDLTLERKPVESTYTTQNFYETNIISAKVSQQFTAKTSVYIKMQQDYDRYPITPEVTSKRIDHTWDAKLGVDMKTRKWLDLGAAYEFKKRSSNDNAYDYENNVTSIYLKATY